MSKEVLDSLLSATAAGDMEAWEALYRLQKRPIYTLCVSILHHPQEAEDVMQETFLVIQRKASLYHSNNPQAWMLTIARNLCYNVLQSRSWKTKLMADNEDESVGQNRLYSDYCQEEMILDSILLKQALSQLNETECKIIFLHAVAGFNYREISEMQDTPLATIAWRFKNGVAKLYRLLEEAYCSCNGKAAV